MPMNLLVYQSVSALAATAPLQWNLRCRSSFSPGFPFSRAVDPPHSCRCAPGSRSPRCDTRYENCHVHSIWMPY
ncbi:hypothetical protein BD414DRAFT_486571 [Trametes punicea]|nr:hypothetical protein BD414DRAFT_486571 [Trametes punicea]